jgi:hypothetical protein
MLLNNGSNVNDKNMFDENPLYLACKQNHKELAQLLLSKGADVNVRNNRDDHTPFSVTRNQEIKQLIIDNEKQKWESMFESMFEKMLEKDDFEEQEEKPKDFEEIEYLDDELNKLYNEFKANHLALSAKSLLTHKFNLPHDDFNAELLEILSAELKKGGKKSKKNKRTNKKKSRTNKRRKSRKSRKYRK